MICYVLPLSKALSFGNIIVLAQQCGGDLDTGYECNKCGYDALPEVEAVKNYDILNMLVYEAELRGDEAGSIM